MSNEQQGIKILYITNWNYEQCLLEALRQNGKSCVLSIEKSIEKMTELLESDFIVCMLHNQKEVEEFCRIENPAIVEKLIVISDVHMHLYGSQFKHNIVCKKNTMLTAVAMLDEVLRWRGGLIDLSVDEILEFINQRSEVLCFHGSADEITDDMDYEMRAIMRAENILIAVYGDASFLEISDVLGAVRNINKNIKIIFGGWYKENAQKQISVIAFVN